VANLVVWWIGAAAGDADVLEEARAQAERVYSLPVRLWHSRERPADAYDPRRNQYSSTKILKWLNSVRPPNALKILGVTDVDLFIPILTFVYGEAQLDGTAAVVSTARLSPNGLAPFAGGLLRARLIKECVHELGHTFGLIHCARPSCVMSRSVNLVHVDAKDGQLCHDCWVRCRELQQRGSQRHDQGTHAYPHR
jgi:archaemetzincin